MPVLALKDVDLSYDVSGSGPALLLLAGTATRSEVWKAHQVPEFSRDHTVITYDQRGIDKSILRSKDFSLASMIGDIVALLDHLKVGKALMWGHSMGGRLAQVMALDHPERVSGLILASTGAGFPNRGVPVGMVLNLEAKGYERYVREHAMHVGVSKEFAAAHPDIVERFMKVRLSNQPPLETYLRHVVARQEIDTAARLSQIRVPTLVTVGGDEGHPSASGVTHQDSSEQLAREIPGASFALIPGAGHYYPYMEPEPTHKAVRAFLAKHPGL